MNPTDLLGSGIKVLEVLLDMATSSGNVAAANALEHAIAALVVERAEIDKIHAATDAELERRKNQETGT